MAPEAFLGGTATNALDIWSLGCTVIEMVTGKPPYWDLGSMAAMFRITQGGHPPIPTNLSSSLENFLHCCFQSEPTQRYTCEQLLAHEWLKPHKIGARARAATLSPEETKLALLSPSERKLNDNDLQVYRDSCLLGRKYDGLAMEDALDELMHLPEPPNLLIPFYERANINEGANFNSEEERLQSEKESLLELCQSLQQQLGEVLSEKQKALVIARKFCESSQAANLSSKQSIAQLQSYKDHQQRYERESTASLR